MAWIKPESRAEPIKNRCTLTCPECGHQKTESMPADACQWFYDCAACHTLLKPKPGDCCVFCSYSDIPCPPVQSKKACCSNH